MCIHEVALHTAHQHGGVGPILELRKRLFVDLLRWKVPVHKGMEYDEFDTVCARYLVGYDEVTGAARIVMRNLLCDRPYMLQSLWADELAPGADLPSDATSVEGTRMGVDLTLPEDEQLRWRHHMSVALIEWALHYGVRQYSFVTYEDIARKGLEREGWDVRYWGPPVDFPQGRFVAGHFPVDEDVLQRFRAKTGITGPVLVPLDDTQAVPPAQQIAAARLAQGAA